MPLLQFSYSLYAEISFGTPAQSIELFVTTGAYDFMVLSATYPEPDMFGRPRYNGTQSSTYTQTGEMFFIPFGPQSALTGEYCLDTVAFGQTTLPATLFAEINNGPSGYISPYTNGILGLGLRLQPYFPETPQLLDTLVSQGVIQSRSFSVYVPRVQGSQGPQLLFGGVDPDHYTGNFTYLPVTTPYDWSVSLTGTSVGGVAIPPAATVMNVIFDLSGPLIYGSSEIIEPICQQIGVPCPQAQSPYDPPATVDCSLVGTLPDVAFTLGQTTFTLPATQYVLVEYYGPEPTCLLAFEQLGNGWTLTGLGPEILVGESFLSYYYANFDVDNLQIGLAKKL